MRSHGTSLGRTHNPKCCCLLTQRIVTAKNLVRFQSNLKNCKCCGKFLDSNRLFCNHSCSASFNNIERIKNGYTVSDEHRKKTSESLKQTFSVTPKVKINNISVKKKSKIKPIIAGPYSKIFSNYCKHCSIGFVTRKKQKYCPNCKSKYSESAKQGYKFTFNVYKYPDLFDLSLLETYGWFAPGGRSGRWNPDGISRDHKVSVNEAIRNNYDQYYISHPLNCELMPHRENDKKKHNSSISYDELIKIVNEYDYKKSIK